MGAVDNPIELIPTTTSENVEALLEAARYNDIDDLQGLASTGVSLDSKDSQGRTALHMASANGHASVVQYLIQQGVDVNASNVEQNTPLHWACLNGHIEVVKLLVLAGANVSALNSHEKTPVDEAAGRGMMDVIDSINETLAQLRNDCHKNGLNLVLGWRLFLEDLYYSSVKTMYIIMWFCHCLFRAVFLKLIHLGMTVGGRDRLLLCDAYQHTWEMVFNDDSRK